VDFSEALVQRGLVREVYNALFQEAGSEIEALLIEQPLRFIEGGLNRNGGLEGPLASFNVGAAGGEGGICGVGLQAGIESREGVVEAFLGNAFLGLGGGAGYQVGAFQSFTNFDEKTGHLGLVGQFAIGGIEFGDGLAEELERVIGGGRGAADRFWFRDQFRFAGRLVFGYPNLVNGAHTDFVFVSGRMQACPCFTRRVSGVFHKFFQDFGMSGLGGVSC
jgi:hypothetical protein